MEVPGGHDNKGKVMLYEFFGTAFLTFAALISLGNPAGVAFTLFAIICFTGPISGANVNPAVTMGVYISQGTYGKDFAFMVLTMLSQFAGGLLAVLMIWSVIGSDPPTEWIA